MSAAEYSAVPSAEMEQVFASLGQVVVDFFEGEEETPVRPYREPDDLRAELGIAIPRTGCRLDQILTKLERVLAATPTTASRRFYNQLFGGRDPAATLAEMLTPLTNNSMYTYKVAGAQVLIELEVIGRMARAVGLDHGEGIFTPGGSLSNLTAMIIARNRAAAGVRDHGLRGERFRVYASSACHYSIVKNAGIMGIGRNNVCQVGVDSEGRMAVAQLRRAIAADLEQGAIPMLIVATAGTTVLGAFDPIPELAEVAAEYGVWLHVDGAFGGSVALCPEYRHLIAGSDLADSFTWCAHKMLGVPLICSAILIREPGLLARNFSEAAEYLFQDDTDDLNPGTRSIQCGRRNDALKLWAAWQFHGDEGYAARIRRQFANARRAAEMIAADPNLVLARQPQSLCLCFAVRGHSSVEICERLDRQARLKVGYGRVDGQDWIRVVTVNPELTEADLETFFAEVTQAARQ